jgi:hypothetical protein
MKFVCYKCVSRQEHVEELTIGGIGKRFCDFCRKQVERSEGRYVSDYVFNRLRTTLRLHVLHRCEAERCNVCDGGLALCNICNGAEGLLPTECPGRKMTDEEEAAVFGGAADFINGKWTVGD